MSESPVQPVNGVYTLYEDSESKVTLTFRSNEHAGFSVVTKELPSSKDLPSGYNWLINFGIKKDGKFVPSASYDLDATGNKSWFIYYKKENENKAKAHPLKGRHTSPGDPPIGTG
jgi:hypothetical protein